MLTVHHLDHSQSERIVWLCEELGLEYEIVQHKRDPQSHLSPDSLANLQGNLLGNSPFIRDGDVALAESGAIMEYIIQKHGGGRLALPPSHPNYSSYLYWFHFGNGTFQPMVFTNMFHRLSKLPPDNPVVEMLQMRLDGMLRILYDRLLKVPYLAGAEFTAADIMVNWTLTTCRYFFPYSLKGYTSILTYLRRVAQRPAYQTAMMKADPEMELVLGADPPPPHKRLL